jgi:4-hydroxy-3-polyprenylbenzoate decarboxylase
MEAKMSYRDFREWLELLDKRGEVKHLSGASWDLEMSGIAEIVYHEGKSPKPALLFSDIPGYPANYRTLFGILASIGRISLTLNLPGIEAGPTGLVKEWRAKTKGLGLIPPKLVKSGPVLANIQTGDQIDLLKFPSPRFHEMDGGRYIGTGHAVIQKDPDTGWHNLGTYRVMLVDRDHLALHIIETQHGATIMRQKYFNHQQDMPIAIAIGIDPALWLTSANTLTPFGTSEYDYAGGIKNEPIEVIEGQYTKLNLPATAEIIIEGVCHRGAVTNEGPFGEWHGYYANLGLSPALEPLIEVKAVYYRDDPILTCANPANLPSDYSLVRAFTSSVGLWNYLEAKGIAGIKSIWCHEVGNGALFNVIAIEQLFAEHSRQVGLLASRYGNLGRYIIVVEDDIDPANIEQVIWAITTRNLPDEAIQILTQCRSNSSDPAISIEKKRKYKDVSKPLVAARVIINTCRPLEQKGSWYPVARVNPQFRTLILEKWHTQLSDLI